MSRILDTSRMSDIHRSRAIDKISKRLLVTNFHGSKQEKDLTDPANCRGLGRIRHFRRITNQNWPSNPLPIDPACQALQHLPINSIKAQVFQNAVCNWRCWYCFVDFELLAGSHKHSEWVTVADLVDLYLDQSDPPPIIDLTGGQPDLVPEWIPWMMQELKKRRLDDRIYLWSDDNLSNDYFWRYLSDEERWLITQYRNYGRVCCFKGFSAESFHFNTLAEPSLFYKQFELFRQLLELGIDIYAYVTLTSPSEANIESDMRKFVDQLQAVDECLPLRTVPLEVREFTPVRTRMNSERQQALENQYLAVSLWRQELNRRFSQEEQQKAIVNVSLNKPMREI